MNESYVSNAQGFFNKTFFDRNMSRKKSSKTFIKYLKNVQPQIPELQFLKSPIFRRAL